MAGMGLDDVTAIDLYSCFPSAVEVACAELGLRENDPRGLTVTGGLPFFGGPGNNYSMHGIAEMVGRLRGKPDEVGLVTANGGYLSKHSMGLYSAQPVEGDWRREDPASYQAALTARPKPAVVEEANGNATIETYTVVFDDQAAPRLGIVVGRLDDGRRFLANIAPDDRTLLGSLVREDGVGTRGRVARENGTNVFRM
jgi:acetyl-CoA C-acetyltransferase